MSNEADKLLAVTEAQLSSAYQWLYQQRKHFPANADSWVLRRDWAANRDQLLQQINRGDYVFSPLKRMTKQNGQTINLWSSQDALVMKALAEILQPQLNLSKSCMHIKGHGGLKQCVSEVQTHLSEYQFVFKTDVKHFYETIDHVMLSEQIHQQVENKILKRYLWQVIRRTVEYGGNYQEITKGISRGCSLSPILGGLYLSALDDKLSQNKNVTYTRYMDDICIMSKTRWHLRVAIKQLNQQFNALKVEQHPDKTFIGRIEKGFDFLGYHFSREPLQLANTTVRRHVERLYQLYEQQNRKKATSQEMTFILGEYVKRWQRWCTAGLSEVRLQVGLYSYVKNPLIRKVLSP